tara:strand:+ start:254 stop:685 length:432 start_codon:yes stop_codon:yes gene_type:complete
MRNSPSALEPKLDFNNIVTVPTVKEEALPFCLRLTPSERSFLEHHAGSRPLGKYMRYVLLGDNVTPRRKQRKPKIDEKLAAALLSEIGQSHIPSNLNQLARHANMGTLDLPDEVERQLQEACAAVLAMREALFVALGLQSGSE